MVALHLVFTENGCGSIRNIVDFLEKTGLDAFVVFSIGHHHVMPEKEVALGEDETFHPQICLVVMALVSG